MQNIINKVGKLNNEINGVWASNMCYEDKIRYSVIKKEKIVDFISKLKISDETFATLIYRVGSEYNDKYGNLKRIGLILLNILFLAHKNQFLNLFKQLKGDVEVLTEDNENLNNKLKIYEKTYKKSTKMIL